MVGEQVLPRGLRVVVGDGLASGGIVEGGGVGKPDFEIVGQFGDGADGGAGGLDGVGLLDCDGGADVFDAVHLGAVEQIHELPGVGGESFHVAALALGMQGLKHQRGFARATQAGDDGELPDGEVEIETFEVVLADAT